MINLRETVEYKKYGYQIVTCPVCGEETLNSFWICEHCNWEYDNTIDEDSFSDVNQDTIKNYRIKYEESKLNGESI